VELRGRRPIQSRKPMVSDEHAHSLAVILDSYSVLFEQTLNPKPETYARARSGCAS
jgi:hypothetical protein